MADDNTSIVIDGIDDLEEIGRGGFAVVYRGHQRAFRRDVAVKVLTRSGLDADDKRRFERECQAMGILSDHPGIVTLFDAGFTADGRPYMVMAHVGGGALSDHLADHGRMSWEDVTRLGVRMCGALETAHRADVLHRDIKPANVLRSNYGEQLSDFGIARIAGGHETRSGIITASLAHAAPEILDGSKPSVQADIYSLGSSLYEAAMGQAAFVKDTDESLLPLIRRVVTDPVPPMGNAGVPNALAAVIETSMAKDPNERYESAEAFGQALRSAQATLGIAQSELAIVKPADRSDPSATTVVGAEMSAPKAETPPPRAITDTTVPPAVHTTGPLDAATTPPSTTPPATTPPPPPPPRLPAEPKPPPPADPPSPPAPGRSGSNRGVIAFVVLGLAAAAAAVYFLVIKDDGKIPTPPDAISTTTASTTTAATSSSTTESTDAPSTTVSAIGGETNGPIVITSTDQFRGQLDDQLEAALPTLESEFGLVPSIVSVEFDNLGTTIGAIAQRGNDPVIAFGSSAAPSIATAAANFPGTTFVIIDGFAEAPNVVSVSFATHQSSYIVGVAAALATSNGRVAFIGGLDDEPTRRYEAGFVAGIRATNGFTQIDISYVDAVGNPDQAALLTETAIAAGADVIYHAASGSGSGVLNTASSLGGVWTIGADIDWYAAAAASQQEFVLTSSLKNYAAALAGALISHDEGSLTPGLVELGLADNAVDFSIQGGFLDAVLPQLQQVGLDLASGTRVAPTAVGARAITPISAECPAEGCIIRIISIQPSGPELVVAIEANWIQATSGIHAHYFWSPTYSAENAGGDALARFGVPSGSWDLDDRYPDYTTENGASVALRGAATELCVTAADRFHNVIDPTLFSCINVTNALG